MKKVHFLSDAHAQRGGGGREIKQLEYVRNFRWMGGTVLSICCLLGAGRRAYLVLVLMNSPCSMLFIIIRSSKQTILMKCSYMYTDKWCWADTFFLDNRAQKRHTKHFLYFFIINGRQIKYPVGFSTRSYHTCSLPLS